jgi:integrase/recombinase XerD
VTQLRKMMLEELQRRNYSKDTIRHHLRAVEEFARYYGKPPDKLGLTELRTYQAYLLNERKLAVGSVVNHVAGLRFFFVKTLKRPEYRDFIPYPKEPERLPTILSLDEVARLINASGNLFRRALLMTTYGTGMRRSEVVHLKVRDIDSKRMIIRVEQGKGGKDRNVMLSPHLLDLLRTWWKAARPRGWLFPGRDPAQPMTTRQLNRACHAAAQMAEISKRVSLHTLRHSFATHLLEQNIDVRVIQVLLGHAKLDTTALYTRVATKTISEVMSPLEHIALKLKEIRPPG